MWEVLENNVGGSPFVFESNTIYNPASLNITNTIDLTEKLTPLFYFVESFLKKKKKVKLNIFFKILY